MTRWPHRQTVIDQFQGMAEGPRLTTIAPVMHSAPRPGDAQRPDPVVGAARKAAEDFRSAVREPCVTTALVTAGVTSAVHDAGRRRGEAATDLAGWELDLQRRELRLRGVAVPLGGRAFEVIEVLVEAGGDLVTKDALMARVWPRAIVGDSALQVHISDIRKALGSDRTMLKTESGRGYRLLGIWNICHQPSPSPSIIGSSQISAATNSTGNLPIVRNSLIGRSEAELLLREFVLAHRVLTLTGPGGVGKTSLALHLADAVFTEFSDGAWLVELASLSDPDLVPSAVSSVLGLEIDREESSPTTLARAISDKNCLLILDNCEHMIDAAADLVEKLIRFCPRITVLTTSREALRIEGEWVYRVLPLDAPSATEEEPGAMLRASAVQLFLARLDALNSNFIPTADDLPPIAAICRLLDGIPLALEFAAARAAALGIQTVLTGLADRFALLTAGFRTALPRHQTLRTNLDWGYDLLPEVERVLLRHLAVFPSSFSIDSASAVVGDVFFNSSAMTAGISNLVGKSWATFDESNATPCWYLFDTIRAYALDKLIQHNEFDNASQLYAAYSLGSLQTD